MNYFKIDGKTYQCVVTAIKESFEILYGDGTGRTVAPSAPMTLSPLGTFFTYNVTVQRKAGYEAEYDELYDLVSTPMSVLDADIDGYDIEIAHNQSTWNFKGYISKGARAIRKIDEKENKIYWGELVLNIVPLKAQKGVKG